ncbi:unnamed protein product (macronuclear) [Paramecium tetraurelia]|uniref:Clathrin/coatomer adaptor adaptin-like N-terminal domain-containing protein n=1 Tax=Paramecium tetraurelia TaxID=5888 RepID=A0CCQ5_PARTE|nr:uncharacterized protein GSPATT00037357001 [Paramecium tetraurelia]CAK68572.1 unnamed protein product [Paramecium tetraurelia]|eukprot:XP_001435969.1 hypothetical protein (macronuclear) [Paramecium tetraurelia strain d4-2]
MSRPSASTSSSSRSSRSRYGKEVKELQDALNQNKIESKRDAIRKIIDAMTRGKDVSMLFPDVAKNMETSNLELKKLVYLYIINYAKIMPDLAVMAVNSFRKDARDKTNPFLRALAIRTMGCIRVKLITEYLLDPLKESIKDEDSYVRKTAAICISKLYDVSPELIEEQGLLKLLDNLLNDGNAMVVANAVCALLIVQESKGTTMLQLNSYTSQKILTAMNECNEWGVIYCLDALAMYVPEDGKEAEAILERVSPRLNHNNPGVVLSACKIMMKFLDYLQNPETLRQNALKMTAPLISLLSLGKEPEIQYVALKNINLIIQKRPIIIEKDIKVFFCNFNDPIYIKLQKLEVLAKLANNDNIQQILHELKEYTQEVDVEFVRKAVRTIGRCAIKFRKSS